MNVQMIGICGLKGAGKTTAANYLVSKGYEEHIFSEALKQVVAVLFGFPYQRLLGLTPEDRKWRETFKDPIWNMTPREALQQIGTDLFRNKFDNDIWVKICLRDAITSIKDGKKIVISDVRFMNEAENILAHGGKLITIYRHPNDLVMNEEKKQMHVSEYTFLNFLDKTTLIRNDGSISELYAKLEAYLK